VEGAGNDLDLRLPGGRIVRADALTWRAVTSGGPGGQHANRTASKVEVSVAIEQLPLEPREKAVLYERLASRITGAGELTAFSQDHRSQLRNRGVAVRRLERLIESALRPRARRIPTKPSFGAKMHARASKQQLSQRKRTRGKRWDVDGEND
jgi:ribosome-associated protein